MKGRLGLLAGLTALIAVLVFVALKMGLPEAADAVIANLREAGPAVFFIAMALLPAVGFPMIAFTLAAGPVFGPTLGTGWVIAWSMIAVVANLLLTYWLSNRALHPLMVRLLGYFRVRLPENISGSAWQIALIVRLAPGLPFWLQNYSLGVLRVPLVPYLVVSTAVMAGYIVALICGGDAIIQGNGRLAFVAVGVLVISVSVLQLLRKRASRRRTPEMIHGSNQPLAAK